MITPEQANRIELGFAELKQSIEFLTEQFEKFQGVVFREGGEIVGKVKEIDRRLDVLSTPLWNKTDAKIRKMYRFQFRRNPTQAELMRHKETFKQGKFTLGGLESEMVDSEEYNPRFPSKEQTDSAIAETKANKAKAEKAKIRRPIPKS